MQNPDNGQSTTDKVANIALQQHTHYSLTPMPLTLSPPSIGESFLTLSFAESLCTTSWNNYTTLCCDKVNGTLVNANPDAPNRPSEPPYDASCQSKATRSQWDACVKQLFDHDFDPNARDQWGILVPRPKMSYFCNKDASLGRSTVALSASTAVSVSKALVVVGLTAVAALTTF